MALTGNEVLYVQGVTPGGSLSPVTEQVTLAQIAGLSGNGITPDTINTNITTAGNGTLTAAALLGGLITRTGPSGAYTDTTDTAAAIVTTVGVFSLGGTFPITIKNATAFSETLSAGAGVTLPATNVIGPFQEASYYAVIGGTAAAPTVTINHLQSGAISDSTGTTTPIIGTLATVGAGTILAALFADGIASRTGSQSNAAFTDTTDTGTAIVAANPALIGKVGASALFVYQNTTNANATLTGGTGVTVSGITVVPAGCTAIYVLTQTAANVLTMVGISVTHPATVSGTFVANGVTPVVVADTRITANSVVLFGLKTAGGTASAPFMTAVTPGTGFSVAAAASNTGTYNYTIFN